MNAYFGGDLCELQGFREVLDNHFASLPEPWRWDSDCGGTLARGLSQKLER
jgi:hypothetical protein